jgi:hypothetical protein
MRDPAACRLPLTIDEINREWLTAALSVHAPGLRVNDFEIVDIIHGTATKIRIRLELDDAGRQAGIPPTVILKGGFEPHSRQMAPTYESEGRGYRDVWPVLGLNSPTCYFADFDTEAAQTIIIMEDLVARGVTFCDPLKPQTYEQVRRRLSSLADLHAKTWNSPELEAGGRWEAIQNGAAMFSSYMERAGYFAPDVWQRFVALPRGAAASVRFHDLDWARRALGQLGPMIEGLPKCIVHGDTHLGNLYEDPDGTPGFFDPIPRQEPPHFEISYHITCALDAADRPRWEESLVRHYLDELSRHGVRAPGFDEVMHYFALFLLLGYAIFLVNESEYQTEAVNTAYTARYSAAMIDHRTKELFEAAEAR